MINDAQVLIIISVNLSTKDVNDAQVLSNVLANLSTKESTKEFIKDAKYTQGEIIISTNLFIKESTKGVDLGVNSTSGNCGFTSQFKL